jgi:hypothetical protein
MLFSNELNPKYPLIVYFDNAHLHEYSFYPSSVRTPMACSKVDKDLAFPGDLE